MDLRNPVQWRVPWTDHYRQMIELAVWAEELGADTVWFSEHHNFEDGYLPQPLTFASAVASRTNRIRLGTAITIGALRHPQHLAEEAAIVDLVSEGRVELGLGAGYAVREYEAFNVDISSRFAATDSTVRTLRELLDHDGVVPPPSQRPFPIWLGYQGRQGARRAGLLGTGLLTLKPESLEPYREGLQEAGHDPASARMGGVIDLIVSEDPEKTLARLLPHYAHQLNTYAALRAEGRDSPPPRMWTAESLSERVRPGAHVLDLAVLPPKEATRVIADRVRSLPVTDVYLWASIAAMPRDIVEEHMQLTFGTVASTLRQMDQSSAADQEFSEGIAPTADSALSRGSTVDLANNRHGGQVGGSWI